MASEALPDRRLELIIANSIITVLSTAVAIWRLTVRFKLAMSSWRHGISDYLMFVAVLLNAAANIVTLYSTREGQGRVDADPFWTPEHKRNHLHLTYASQIMNVYALFFIKLSISAYLISLYFSRSYKAVIWAAVFVIWLCNFIIPNITLYGQCRPISMRWDPRVSGRCWPQSVRIANAYIQAGANVITDFVFTASPLIYLQQVKLPKRTRWGVRIVFLLCFLGTILSIVKIWALHNVLQVIKEDSSYHSVVVSILSAWEVGISMITACLPPLRKTFDQLLGRIVFSTAGDSKTGRTGTGTYGLSTYRTNNTSNRMTTVNDDENEWRRLEEERGGDPMGAPMGGTTLITAENIYDDVGERHVGWRRSKP